LLIDHSPFVIKVFGIVAQDITMQGWLLRSQRFPIFANPQPSPLRPFSVGADRFALKQVLAEGVMVNRPTCFVIRSRSLLKHQVPMLQCPSEQFAPS
jgi:hypothetical protein